MEMDKIYIIGAGGEGQVVADLLMSNGLTPSGFFDDNETLHGKEFLGVPVIGVVEKAKEFKGKFLIGIGDNKVRKKIFEFLRFPLDNYLTQVNKLTYIGSGSSIGFGSIVLGGVVISTQAKIGNFVILSIGAMISHHDIIEDFAFIGPNSALGGNVHVGEGAFIGLGASVIPGIRIGKWSVVGAGSVIIEDVPDYATVVGNPGKVIKIRGERVK
jgi:acetyltransferase EpsM